MTYEEAELWLSRHYGTSSWSEDSPGVWRCTVRAHGRENARTTEDGSQDGKRSTFAATVHELTVMLDD